MSEFKGTKGKWAFRHSESKTAYNVVGTRFGDKYKIARVPYLLFPDDSLKLKESEKKQAYFDALLISKAPEMLEMLEIINEGIQTMDFTQLEILQPEIEDLIKSSTEVKEDK